MPRYLIKGETGKTLGAGGYWLGDTLKAVNATLRFESLGMDRLTWTARTVDIAAGETTVPVQPSSAMPMGMVSRA